MKPATLRQRAARFHRNASAARLPASTLRTAQRPLDLGELPNMIVKLFLALAAFSPPEWFCIFDAPMRAGVDLVLLGLPSRIAETVNAENLWHRRHRSQGAHEF